VRVYAESNFVLELALEQEDCPHCEHLLTLATAGRIDLVLPAYALLEPAETLTRRLREWEQLARNVDTELKQLRRNPALQSAADALTGLALKGVKLATDRHDKVRSDLLRAARIIAVDKPVLVEAERLRLQYDLELPDATMLAAVFADTSVNAATSVFINKNSKDFADPAIQTDLQSRQCKFIGSFANARQRIDSILATQT
jgi:hypothetical protein